MDFSADYKDGHEYLERILAYILITGGKGGWGSNKLIKIKYFAGVSRLTSLCSLAVYSIFLSCL